MKILIIYFFYFTKLYALDASQIYEKSAEGVVKINIYQQGIKVGHGTGFFIDSQGTLVTNYHVISEVYVSGYFAEVETKDGKKFKDPKVINCFDDTNEDLCILKVDYQPKKWIDLELKNPIPGQRIYVIGHPIDLDYSITQGIVSGIRIQNPNLPFKKVIQIDASISPGNSGGPVLNEEGKAIGITTYMYTYDHSQNLNFALSSDYITRKLELEKSSKEEKIYPALSVYMNNFYERRKIFYANLEKKVVEPIWEKLKKGDFSQPKNFQVVNFRTFNDKFKTFVPASLLENCHRNDKFKNELFSVLCVAKNQDAVKFHFDAIKLPTGQNSLPSESYSQGQIIDELPLVTSLKKSGQWEKISKNLTKNQIKYLHTFVSRPICRVEKGHKVFKGSKHCAYTVYNSLCPNCLSYNLEVLKDGIVYQLGFWMDEPVKAQLYILTLPLIYQFIHRAEPEMRSIASDNKSIKN